MINILYPRYPAAVTFAAAGFLTAAVVSCNAPSASNNTISTPYSDDAQADQSIQWPTITLTEPADRLVPKGQQVTLTFQLSHPKQQWVVMNYDVGSGMIMNNKSAQKEKGELKVETNLKREKNFINLIIRNLSACQMLGMDEKQCLGKHSLRPLKRDLEFPLAVVIIATEPTDEDVQKTITRCMEDPACRALFESIAADACDSLHSNHFDFRVAAEERMSMALGLGMDWLNSYKNNGFDPVEAILGTFAMLETSKEENNETRAEKNKLKGKYEKCLKDFISADI